MTTQDNDDFSDLHFGPFYQKETRYVDAGVQSYVIQKQSCVEWTVDENADGTWKLVRALAVITPIIGGLLLIVLWFAPFFPGRVVSQRTWRIIAALYILLVTPMQGLTFLFFQSNACHENPVVTSLEEDFGRSDLYTDLCEWDSGSTANVFSVALWLAAGIAMIVQGPPRMPEASPPEIQAVTYERATLSDGTNEVHEVSVVKRTQTESPKL